MRVFILGPACRSISGPQILNENHRRETIINGFFAERCDAQAEACGSLSDSEETGQKHEEVQQSEGKEKQRQESDEHQ